MNNIEQKTKKATAFKNRRFLAQKEGFEPSRGF